MKTDLEVILAAKEISHKMTKQINSIYELLHHYETIRGEIDNIIRRYPNRVGWRDQLKTVLRKAIDANRDISDSVNKGLL
jgi:hypothetical protein